MKPERTKEEILTEVFLRGTPKVPYSSALFDIMLKAMEEYKSQSSPVESKWVSVDERLPERNKLVLVCYEYKFSNQSITKGIFGRAGWSIQYADGWSAPDPENNITHWQPLPELPPIEETKEK